MKQIDENVKKSNFTSKPYTSRNNMASSVSYNEYNTLKLKLINQQKTINNTKNNMEKMTTSINKFNETFFSSNLSLSKAYLQRFLNFTSINKDHKEINLMNY